jgi:large subunit ribosomal protein L1
MDKQSVIKTIKSARESSKKRKFSQRVDVIVNLKNLDFKKPEHQVDFFLNYHKSLGKPRKICAFVGPELKEEAQKVCDFTIEASDFNKYQEDKKLIKKLVDEYDFFIAQANIMAAVAATFGRILGPKNKMPNPKAGCVVPPKAAIKPLYERLQKTSRLVAKRTPIVQTVVGSEDMSDEDLAENVMTLYDQLIHHLVAEENNIKSIYIKFTMGSPLKVA